MKKVVGIFLAILILLPFSLCTVSADENLTISSTIAKNKDKTYTVEVSVSANPGIKGLKLILANDDALKISKITSLDTFGKGDVSGQNVSWTFAEENKKTGKILKFVVSVDDKKQTGEKNVFITGTAFDDKNANVNVNSVSHKVKIECAEHNFQNWVTVQKATCTKPGAKQRKCTVCGFVEEEETEMVNHTYTKWVTETEATCETAGVKSSMCNVCGEEVTKESEPLGHKFSDGVVIQYATLWSEGIQKGICTRCEQMENQTIVPNDQHAGTGVRVQTILGAFEENTKFEAALYGSLTEEHQAYQSVVAENVTDYLVYDLSFVKEGEKVNPKEMVKFAVPFKFSFSRDTVLVYRYVDEQMIPVEFTVQENFAIFDTMDTGIYIITDETPKKQYTVSDEDLVVPDFEVKEVTTWMKILYIVIAVVAVGFLAIITYVSVGRR